MAVRRILMLASCAAALACPPALAQEPDDAVAERAAEFAQEALDLAWFTPAEAASPAVIRQMTGGQDRLLRLALAHVGQLP